MSELAASTSPSNSSTPGPRRFRLRTFGTVSLEEELGDGRTETLLRSGKPLALLIYLHTHGRRSIPRERLADLLWGDESPERARGSLRQALHTVRRSVGDEVLVADREQVGYVPGLVQSDWDAVADAARAVDVPALLAVYAGPFCPRLDVAASAGFEQWVTAERGRLERLVVDLVGGRIAQDLRRGRVPAALDAARRLVAVAPEAVSATALLFDALVAAGERAEARERVEAARLAFEADGQTVPPDIAARSERVRRFEAAGLPDPAASVEMLGHVLVGREAPMSALLRAGEQARTGRPRRLAIVGAAGLGKSRLLEEFEVRMRLRGARAVRVRFLPGMREIPFAALADVLRGLTVLPGALGVDEASARVLVHLVPELADRFPGLEAPGGATPPSVLASREAMADLLACVAEDRLILLLLDDLQYADDASRQLLGAVTRAPGSRLLEVIAVRPEFAVESLDADELLTLRPLDVEGIRALLTAVAAVPAAPWAAEMMARLERRTGGVPQALLTVLRTLADERLIEVRQGGWVCADAARLLERIDRAEGVAAVLRTLDPAALELLQLLAAWARPMDERDLAALVEAPGTVTQGLRRLESLGLVQPRDASWAVAHDSVVEAVATLVAPADAESTVMRFVRHWARHPRLTPSIVEHLGFLCGAHDDLAAARRLVMSAAGRRRTRVVGLRGTAFADAVARAAGRADWVTPLRGAVGFIARRSDRGLALLGAGAMLGLGTFVWLLVMLQPRLVMETEPIVESSGKGVYQFIVQPRVAVQDGFGRRLDLGFPVRAAVASHEIYGDSVGTLRHGRYQFERLVMQRDARAPAPVPEAWRVEVRGPWYVRRASTRLRGVGSSVTEDAFRPVALRVSTGAVVGPMHVRVPLGDSLRFDLTFEYTTIEATANYLVGASAVWGDRRTSVIRLAGLPSPVTAAWRTVTFVVPPPPDTGMHHVVILLGREDRADFLFSSTNWMVGRPIWFDGNDVVDQPPAVLERLRGEGRLMVPRYLTQAYPGQLPDVRVGTRILSTSQGPIPVSAVVFNHLGTAIRVDVVRR